MKPVLATGVVIWFNAQKGFGFVQSEDYTSKIFLHSNVLRDFGRSSVAEGARVSGWIDPDEPQLRFRELVDIEPPRRNPPKFDQLDQAVLDQFDTLPFHPARVKWFDRAKGYGFAMIFGVSSIEVLIHLEVLRHAGLNDLFTGEAISIRVIDGPRGPMAVQIGSWNGDDRA